MKKGDRVITPHGEGRIVKQEAQEGILSHRWCVRFESLPELLSLLQEKQGGLYIMDKDFDEMKLKIKD